MKKWLKKRVPTRKSIQETQGIKTLSSFFKDPCFWSYDQQPVARGAAAGLAGAVLPGFQIFYAALLVIVLRGNVAIALLSTLITNPLTVVPITYFISYIGSLFLGNGSSADFVIHDFKWNFTSFHAFWSNASEWLFQFGKAYLVGLPIVSLCLGIVGYFGTLIFWQAYILLIQRKKKK